MMTISEISSHFKDGRSRRGCRYSFSAVTRLLAYGAASACASVASIHRFASQRLSNPQLKSMGFPDGKLPCARTLRRVAARAEVNIQRETSPEKSVLHMDGKTSRATRCRDRRGVHIVNLYDGDGHALISQEACANNEGERTAARRLLEKTDVSGAIITADAGFTSGALPEAAHAAGADYLLRVKDNTPHLRDAVDLRVKQQGKRRGNTAEEIFLRRGHVYERRVTVLPAPALQQSLPHYLRHAEQFGLITNTVTDKHTGHVTVSQHAFITSVPESQADAADLLRMHRQHWRVENDLHRPKDLYLHEDRCTCRQGNAPQILAAIRSIAVTILKRVNGNICAAIDTVRAKPREFLNACNL